MSIHVYIYNILPSSSLNIQRVWTATPIVQEVTGSISSQGLPHDYAEPTKLNPKREESLALNGEKGKLCTILATLYIYMAALIYDLFFLIDIVLCYWFIKQRFNYLYVPVHTSSVYIRTCELSFPYSVSYQLFAAILMHLDLYFASNCQIVS